MEDRRTNRSKPARDAGTDKRPVEGACPCGGEEVVWVHGHYQCARCGRVLHDCCEGEPW